MNLIQKITSDPLQQQAIVLADGTSFSMTMYFIPLQQGWFFTEIVYGTFVLNGLRICNNPNMLYQFKNILPFGIACFSKENREPSLQQDFSSGNSQLYLLTEAEVQEYTDYIELGTTPS
jgi:hypothetical protein